MTTAGGHSTLGPRLRTTIGGVLVFLIAFAPLAIGTVHPWTRTLVFSAAQLALLLTLAERLATGKRFPVTVPSVALLLGVVFSALQLVPVPAAVIARLSPAAHEVFSATLGDYRMHALSLDPSQTIGEIAKLGCYLAFFVAACTYASRTHRRRQLLVAVTGVATLVAAIGLVAAALHIRKILFFYQPHAEWGTLVRGTFVNPNHFGGLMVLAAPIAIALGLREARLRWVAFPAAILINVACVLSLSRSTIVAAVVGQVMVFVLDRLQLLRGSERIGSRRAARATMAILVVAALGLGLSLGAARLRPEVARTRGELSNPHSKVHAWKRASVLIWKYPWTGVGRGAFEQGFTQVDDRGGHVRFPWIENAYIQVTADWGVPAAVLLFLLAGWALVLAYQRLDEDPLAIGALSGIAALAVHEAADFAVELPGVALPALAVLATLFARRSSEPETGRRRIVVRTWYLLAPVALATVTIVTLRFPSAEKDAIRLTRLTRDPAVGTEDALHAGIQVRGRHPADYFVHLVVAERLARDHHPATMAWLNRAILLNPTHPTPHLMAGEVLADARDVRFKAQALLEFRTAAANAVEPRTVIQAVARHYPGFADLVAATPATTRHRMLLGKWLTAAARGDDADRAYQLVVETDPRNVAAHRRLLEYSIARGDVSAAKTRADALLDVDRSDPSRRLVVRERVLAHDLAGAQQLLRELGRTHDDFELHLLVAREASAAGRHDEARTQLERIEKTWQLDRTALAELYETRAELERQAGNEHQARWNTDQAARLRNP